MIIELDLIKEAKEKLGDKAVGIIVEDLKLEKFDEKNFKACCPFHKEDTPSFIWNSKNYSWKCFGCSVNYDIINHYMNFYKLTYLQALQMLFDQVKIDYRFPDVGVKSDRSYRYPHSENGNREQAEKYLALRGISKRTLDYCDIQSDEYGNIAFPFYNENDVLMLMKYRHSRKLIKDDVKCWCQKESDTTPLLFNMNRIDPTKPLLITEGECFPGDTEVLTPNGWVELKEYNNQQVMQVNEDLSGEFILPLAYINKYYDGNLIEYKSSHTNVSCTEDHNLVILKNNKLIKKKPLDIPEKANIPTSIICDNNTIGLSNYEIALQIAVCADGHLRFAKNHILCAMEFKKKRKIDRIIEILKYLNIEYFLNVSCKTRPNVTRISFKLPNYIKNKELPIEWIYNTSYKQKIFILYEISKWDGSIFKHRMQFTSKYKKETDTVQTIAHCCGLKASYSYYNNLHYCRIFLDKKKSIIPWRDKKTRLKIIKNYNNQVYCVTVPSGMILIRQNNKIFVCGNCDTLAAIETGFMNCVSVPFGAQTETWINTNWDWLEQFNKIIIAFDNDSVGQNARKNICHRLGNWRTCYVDIPPMIDGQKVKDINDVLFRCGKQKVLDLIENTSEAPLEDFIEIDDVYPFDLKKEQGVLTGLREIDSTLHKLYFGNLVIWTGKRGNGKSVMANQIAIAQPLNQGYNVAAFSLELPNPMIRSWIDRNIAGREKITLEDEKIPVIDGETYRQIADWRKGRLFLYNNEINRDHEHILKRIEEIVRRKGVKSILLDNFMMVDLNCGDKDKLEKQVEFIKELIILARRLYCIIHLVAHPRKTQNNDLQNDDVSGSGHITDLAQYVFAIKRFSDKDKAGDGNNYDLSMTILKNRITGVQDKEIMLYFDYPSYRIYDCAETLWFRYGWNEDQSPLPTDNPKAILPQPF